MVQAVWGDLLISYNGQALKYDAIGNPETYRDGITLTWQNGRELASFTNADTSVSYTYDASGMRTSKTLTSDGATDTVKYVYENGLLLQMRYNHMYFDFIYDANGNPVSMAYRSTAASSPIYYYYGLNSRGDVIALYYNTGALYAKYTYDVYGKLLSITNSSGSPINTKYSPAKLNPLRYRGYVYDTETGFYYLQTRYYDPTTCRFINQDIYYDTGIGLTGLNMFAYCNNNPVNCIDAYGALTVSFSISGNLTFIMGVQFSIGIAFDSHRNIDIQWSYVDFDDDSGTFMIGLWNFGIGASTQILNVDSIYDLYGPAYYFGGSVGEGIGTYGGIDLVVFDEEPKDRVRGIQTTIGWGGGVDVIHMYAPSTKSVLSKNNDSPKNPNFINSAKSAQYYIQKLTVMEKRMGGTV